MEAEPEQATADRKPEDENRGEHADNSGHAWRQEPAGFRRNPTKNQVKQPRQSDEDREGDQCDSADPERMRCLQRRELHQLADRVLPLFCLPQRYYDYDHADRGGTKPGKTQRPARGRRQLHIGPEPTAEHADAVPGCKRASREHALRDKGPRQQRRGEGERKEQGSQQQAGRKQNLDSFVIEREMTLTGKDPFAAAAWTETE